MQITARNRIMLKLFSRLAEVVLIAIRYKFQTRASGIANG